MRITLYKKFTYILDNISNEVTFNNVYETLRLKPNTKIYTFYKINMITRTTLIVIQVY